MSYVLHIWQHPQGEPLPTDIQSASRWHEQLSRISGQPSPHFIALAQLLCEIFADEESEDDFDADGVWLEEPPKAGTNCVWALGLNSAQIQRSVPAIVQEANALGLMVFDQQSSSAYLPSRQVVGQQINWSANAQDTSTGSVGEKPFENMREPETVFVTMMEPILRPHGFKYVKSKHSFVRTFPEIKQELSFFVDGWEPDYQCKMFIDLEARLKPSQFTKAVERVSISLQLSWLYPLASPNASAPSWETPKQDEGNTYIGIFQAGSAKQLRQRLLPIAKYYVEVVIPILELCSNFKGVHNCINDDDRKKRIIDIRRRDNLYFAHLAQSTNIEKLSQAIATPMDALACTDRYKDQERLAKRIAEQDSAVMGSWRWIQPALELFEQHPYPYR